MTTREWEIACARSLAQSRAKRDQWAEPSAAWILGIIILATLGAGALIGIVAAVFT